MQLHVRDKEDDDRVPLEHQESQAPKQYHRSGIRESKAKSSRDHSSQVRSGHDVSIAGTIDLVIVCTGVTQSSLHNY
jgi:hypothetical protein